MAKLLDRLGRHGERVVPARWTMPFLAAAQWLAGEPELRELSRLVPADRLAVDVGAAEGVWSWFLARRARSVVAFEPNPDSAARIVRRVPRAVVHAVALSDREGEAELRIPRVGGQSLTGWATIEPANRHTALAPERWESIRVPTRTLDSFELRDVGFVKIDVEGHELAVLEGARRTILRDRPVILVEAEDRHRPGAVASVVVWLEAIEYRQPGGVRASADGGGSRNLLFLG